MQYDFIGISKQNIVGIKNPKLIIEGVIDKKNCNFEIFIDGKKKKEYNYKNSKKNFLVELELSKSDKIIETFVVYNKKKYKISILKNSLHSRTKNKIIYILNKFIKKAKNIFRKICCLFHLLYKGIKFSWKEYHFLIPPILWSKYWKIFINKIKNIGVDEPYYNPFNVGQYNMWLNKQEETKYKKLKYNPLISIIIPVYNIREDLLEDCLDSVLNQKYENFEICIADDHSTKQTTIDTLKKYEKLDDRIKVIYRNENGHISEASNSAIKIAKGEFIAFLDDDDLLTEDALYFVAEALNKDKTIDMIYTDEDKMDLNGNLCEPYFKPDFSPDTLLSFNYITHFAIYRKKLVDELGGLKSKYNGAQDYDFVLRFSEITDKIYHIPKITYHWRQVEGSTALKMNAKNYALEAGKKAIEDALKRRNILGKVILPVPMAHYIVEYKYEKEPMISILIPTKDYADTLLTCINSIYKKTKYKNYEIIVINNSSKEEKTFKLFEKYKKEHNNFKVIDANMEFNYSKINNIGAKNAIGDYLVLLNNDTEVITPEWLHYMVGYAMQEHIGAVGAKLFYPDNTIQHCGVVLGIANTAGHHGVGVDRDDNGPFARYLVPQNYGAVTAACLMVSKKKYFEVGGLDEELKVAFNDVEFNIKLLKKGYYNVCLPQVQLYHFESKSRGLDTTGEKYKRFLIESDLLRKKGGDYIERDPFYNDNMSKIYPMMLDK